MIYFVQLPVLSYLVYLKDSFNRYGYLPSQCPFCIDKDTQGLLLPHRSALRRFYREGHTAHVEDK